MKKCSKCKQFKSLDNFYWHTVKGKRYKFSWCKQCIKEKDRKRYKENREVELEKRKKWQRENPEKVKEIRRKTTWKIKVETLQQYGGKCVCCGEDEIKFLAIDHINNDGAKQRKELKQTRGATGGFYYWLKKNNYPEGYQVLCHNCNMAKAFYGVCPHQNND